MNLITNLYLLTFFLMVVGALLIWISIKRRGLDVEIKITNLLFVFGLAYVLLAHFSLAGGVGLGISEFSTAPCESQINTTFLNSSSNTTTYTYVNSCEGLEAPATAGKIYKILLWVVWMDYMMILLGFAVFLVQHVKRLW